MVTTAVLILVAITAVAGALKAIASAVAMVRSRRQDHEFLLTMQERGFDHDALVALAAKLFDPAQKQQEPPEVEQK